VYILSCPSVQVRPEELYSIQNVYLQEIWNPLSLAIQITSSHTTASKCSIFLENASFQYDQAAIIKNMTNYRLYNPQSRRQIGEFENGNAED
jgi:hypothetical protein